MKVLLEFVRLAAMLLLGPHRPNQPFEVLLDHVVERLSGCDAPQLHVVSFNGTEETAVSIEIHMASTFTSLR